MLRSNLFIIYTLYPAIALLSLVAGGCGGSTETSSLPPPASSPEPMMQPIFTPDQPQEPATMGDQGASGGTSSYGGEESGGAYSGDPSTTSSDSGRPQAGWQPDSEEGNPNIFGGGNFGATGSTGGQTSSSNSSGGSSGAGRTLGPPSGLSMGEPEGAGMMFGGQQFGMGDTFGAAGDGQHASRSFSFVSVFIQQNCISCHSANRMMGDVRLDRVSDDLSADKNLWQAVLSQLEAGSMPPPNSLQPDPSQKAMVIEFIKESLGEDAEMDFMQRAELAFKRSEFEKAMNLFYAHTLTVSDQEAISALNHVKLYRPNVPKPEDLIANNESAANIKPRLDTQLTFAVGILLDASTQVTDVKPIGVSQFGGAGGMGAGDMGGFGRGSTGPKSGNRMEAFEDLTGDYGKSLVNAYRQRLTDGKYGTLFATIKASDGSKTNTPFDGFAGGGGLFGGGNDDFGGGAFGGGPPGLDSGRMNPGMGGGSGLGGGGAAGSTSSVTLADKELASGLTYLGVGSVSELLRKAVAINADGLFLFDIKAALNPRNRIVTNDTRLRFMLTSGKVVATSARTLKNIDIERAIKQNKDSDEVQKQIDHVFGRLDDILVFENVPKMSGTAAMRHIHSQYHAGVEPLKLMAHARLYHLNGIISSDQLSTVYQVILEGNDGLSLAEGTEADRQLVLNMLMPDL